MVLDESAEVKNAILAAAYGSAMFNQGLRNIQALVAAQAKPPGEIQVFPVGKEIRVEIFRAAQFHGLQRGFSIHRSSSGNSKNPRIVIVLMMIDLQLAALAAAAATAEHDSRPIQQALSAGSPN